MDARRRKRTAARGWAAVAAGLLLLAAAVGPPLLARGPAQAAAALPADPPEGTYVPGEVLVKFRAGTPPAARARSLASRGSRKLRDLGPDGLARAALAPGQRVADAVAAFLGDPSVEYAQPNYVYTAHAAPDDPRYGELWGLANVGQTVPDGAYAANNPGVPGMDVQAEAAWETTTDCRGTVAAVVDTGVNYRHEDLAANMWDGGAAYPSHGYDFVDGDADPVDENGHGTHVAGVLGAAGDNGTGTAGVCWTARIMAVRVLDAAGNGTTATVVEGIGFAVARGAEVVNLSLGGSQRDPAFDDAIGEAERRGVVVVVSAGNEGRDNDGGATPSYPCAFTRANLVCVAALDQAFALASFSNYGRTSVDVGAPGTNVLGEWAGTAATVADDFNTRGVLDWSTSTTRAGGWVYGRRALSDGITYDMLLDPSSWPSGSYANDTDDRVYKTFDLGGADAAVLRFGVVADTEPGADFFEVGAGDGGGDPFRSGGVRLYRFSGSTGGSVLPAALDLRGCLSPTCAVGFRLVTSPLVSGRGAAVLRFRIDTLRLDGAAYRVASGTSMAAPYVSGVAAMLRSYNPAYTYRDVIDAVTAGGRPVTSLDGKTVTGRAVSAAGALAYIHAPTGVRVALR